MDIAVSLDENYFKYDPDSIDCSINQKKTLIVILDLYVENIYHYDGAPLQSAFTAARDAASAIWPDKGCKLYEKVHILGYVGNLYEKTVSSKQECIDYLNELEKLSLKI